MKTTKLLLIAALFLGACTDYKQIGKLTMVANRNVDSKADYVLVRAYMGGSKSEIKRLKAKTIEDAIDNVVRATPGGEFLKNCKIYLVDGTYYAIEGDVWGLAGQNFKGFAVGDKVQYAGTFKTRKGTIVELKNDKQCMVKLEDSGEVKEVNYSDLKKDY